MHDHARDLNQRGFSVFEDMLDATEVDGLRRSVEELVREIDPPCFWASPAVTLSDRATVTAPGLAIGRLLHERPALRPRVLPERLLEAMRATLGDDVVLELAGAVVSDEARPFFTWHTHIEGLDEDVRYLKRSWPPIKSVQRVLTLLYLQDLDARMGPLYVLPRRAGDPTPPPYDLERREWPEMIELRPRAGTVVALDQCTWHAAGSLRGPGLRTFVGCYFAARSTKRHDWADPTLAELARADAAPT